MVDSVVVHEALRIMRYSTSHSRSQESSVRDNQPVCRLPLGNRTLFCCAFVT